MRVTINSAAVALLATTMLVMPAAAPSLHLGTTSALAAGVGAGGGIGGSGGIGGGLGGAGLGGAAALERAVAPVPEAAVRAWAAPAAAESALGLAAWMPAAAQVRVSAPA